MIVNLLLKYNYNNELYFLLEFEDCRKLINVIQFDFREDKGAEKAIDIFFSFLDNFKMIVELKKNKKYGDVENKEELFETILLFYKSMSMNNQPTKIDKLVEIV